MMEMSVDGGFKRGGFGEDGFEQRLLFIMLLVTI
jgi:hypothetical protein